MPDIALFCEDFGHEQFIGALIRRLADQYGMRIAIRPYSVVGGHGRALSELRTFVRDLHRGQVERPDILVVAIDANCNAFGEVKKKIFGITEEFSEFIVCAVPDPHVERWMLIDSNAFNQVFGVGCNMPDSKCQKDRFKRFLLKEVQASGLRPQLGGMEFAEDIVSELNLRFIERADQSLGSLIKDLKTIFKRLNQQNRPDPI